MTQPGDDLVERAVERIRETIHQAPDGTWWNQRVPGPPAAEDLAIVLSALAAMPSLDAPAMREALEPFARMADEMERVAEQHAVHPSKIGRSHKYDDCVRARTVFSELTL